MEALLLVLAIVALAVIGSGVTWRRRRAAEQRRANRDRHRREQQAAWNRHMAGKPPGPGHNSPLR